MNDLTRKVLSSLFCGVLACSALFATPAYADDYDEQIARHEQEAKEQGQAAEAHEQEAQEQQEEAAAHEQAASEAGAAYEAAQTELAELQKRVEASTTAYNEAQARLDQLNADIAAKQESIDQIEAQLPELRDRASEAMRGMYKLQQGAPGLVGLILASDDFNEFLAMVTYIDAVQERNFAAVDELIESEKELARQKAELDHQQAAAAEETKAAETALAEAQAARDEVQRRAEEEAARQAAEAQAAIEAAIAAQEAAQAAEAARQAQEAAIKAGEDAKQAKQVFETTGGQEAAIEVPNSYVPSSINWDVPRDQFVEEWTGRIDAYLAGSPLEGHGRTFAEAAWDYGVDPRWSPAISCTESSKGRYCFLPHNAWGWGHVSWPDWDTAIRDHVAGLAGGYGTTITVAHAKKYCPPNWQFWYATTLAQMEHI